MPTLLMVNPADDEEWEARTNPEGQAPGEVVKKLDEGMYPVIIKAQAGDETAIAELWKRYKKYAKNFAIKYLTESREGQKGQLSRAAAGQMADDVASEALTRVFVGYKRKNGKVSAPMINRWVDGKASMATFIAAAVKNVAREGARAYAKGGRARSHTTAGGEDYIETIASDAPSPEDQVVDDEGTGEVIDPTEMTAAEANRVQKMIDSGDLDYDDEMRARAMLEQWDQAQRNSGRIAEQTSAVEEAMDNAGAGDGLSSEEATILGLRGEGKSYKQIAQELFGSDDKKAVQRVMVRLHRARKSLERTTGLELHGIEANLGGIGYTKRGRKRKNPELVIYFEDAIDLEDLFSCGLIDGVGYQACLASLLQSIDYSGG